MKFEADYNADIELQNAITRIQQMEQYLDEVLEVLGEDEEFGVDVEFRELSAEARVSVQEKIEKLKEYYEGGLWLRDYEMDERGELPKMLKRGVLGQDTLYNLFIYKK